MSSPETTPTTEPPATQAPVPARPPGVSIKSRAQLLAARSKRMKYLWRPAAALALLALGVFLAWQAMLLRSQQQAGESMGTTVKQAEPLLARPLKAAEDKLTLTLQDPEFLQSLSEDSDDARKQAAAKLQKLLPQASDVAVYSTRPDALIDDDAHVLGYVRAAQLARAQSGGSSQMAAAVLKGGEHKLLLVQPVRKDKDTVAFAAVQLPFDPISRAFNSDVYLASGRLDLRLGPDADSLALLSRGSGAGDEVDVAQHIPDSELWLTGTRAAKRAWLPDSLPATPLLVLALLAVLGAAVVGWGQRMSRLPALVPRRGKGGADPTLAEVLDREQQSAAAGKAAAGSPAPPRPSAAAIAVDRSIFRAYDIRGVVGKTLNTEVARLLGLAIGSEARDRGQDEIVVGRDGRLSGPELSSALIEGLRASGVDVIDIGQAPSPVVYFACYQLNTGSGVAVTGSHNPPDYNGFKIVLGGETLAMDAIQGLYTRIAEHRFSEGMGQLRSMNINDEYIERIANDVQAQKPLKVVVDCGNGVTGDIGPRVLEEIGCEVVPLYAEIDGNFPNHHPDPSDPANLRDLILSVKHKGADLGIAFDGDGDRLGVVTRDGDIIFPDQLLMLFAMDVLVRDPGATIIYDVKCTGHLQPLILRHGGSPLMWKTGHSLIKAKMRETDAALAGEMSGHFFFRERWYGFDDGIYAAARLIEILAGDIEERSPEQIFAALPKGVSTPELKVATAEGENHQFVDTFCKKARFEDARITTIDGLRADWPDGWGLVRASNTTPSLVLRFDADNQGALDRIMDEFRRQILAINPELVLPF